MFKFRPFFSDDSWFVFDRMLNKIDRLDDSSGFVSTFVTTEFDKKYKISNKEDGSAVIEVELPGVDPNTVRVDHNDSGIYVNYVKGQSKGLIKIPRIITTGATTKADLKHGLLTLTVTPPKKEKEANSIKVNIL